MQKLKIGILFLIISLAFTLMGWNTYPTSIAETNALKKLKSLFQLFHKTNRNERVHISTDKTFYKPGEIIWFTAFVRNEDDLQSTEISDILHVELINPRGSVDQKYKLIIKNGVAKGDFDLSNKLGGLYKLKAYTEFQKNDTAILGAEKEITIQSVVLPRLKMKLDFDKKAYGKGDEVTAKITVTTNEDKPLVGSKINYTLSINGEKISAAETNANDKGLANVKCILPKDLKSTDALLNVTIKFEGDVEAISRAVPVILNKIDLSFFPESGDLIEGVQSAVAFRALNEYGKPADIEGAIYDENNNSIVSFSSYHNGMGKFDFLPTTGKRYTAKITKPEGISETYSLPDALAGGYLIQAKDGANGKLDLNIYSYKKDTVSILTQLRGQIIHSNSIATIKGWNKFPITVPTNKTGVAQITLFDGKGIARAERLLYINKDKLLKIKITPSKETYQPREKVSLQIRTTDEQGLPVSSDLALSVVDDNLLSFADDKQGSILAKILLEPELKEKVHEPNFYFDSNNPKSREALDLLMMTSGWRRYTWKQIKDFKEKELAYKAERAVLSGKVLSSDDNNPLSGVKVLLKKSGLYVVTDKEGNFALPFFDITTDNELQIQAAGYESYHATLNDYAQGESYYLNNNQYRRRVYKLFDANIPEEEAAEDKMQINQGVFAQMARVPMAANAPIKEAKVFFNMDVAAKPNEKKDNNDGHDEFANKNFEPVAVGDIRLADIIKGEKDKEEQAPAKYYRAKEFPKKVYSNNDYTRTDLASTVYWNGHLHTDQNGKATVEFITNDLISSFRVSAEGFGENGMVGRGEKNFTVNIPFAIDTKIPTELVSGDLINIPVFLKNNSDTKAEGTLKLTLPKGLNLNGIATEQNLTIEPKEVKKIILPLTVTSEIGKMNLTISFIGNFNDRLQRDISIVAKGFPANISFSAQELNKTYYLNPENIVEGSMRVTFTAYPNILSELMKGVEAILREPYGCFEQTSSSNYPNIMVLDYMRKMKIANPEMEARAAKLLDEGYRKLIAFETKENGYEWFGAAPAHEALTAYGLMEFEDMKAVYSKVDQGMIDRTRKILLDKRDGKGGFKRNPRALDQFGGADEDITNAYIVYALTESGYKDLKTELEALYESAKKSKDPYVLALAANALLNVQDSKRGEDILSLLFKEQSDFGYWIGKRHSITRSTGEALKIETTSLVLLAIMKSQNANQGALQNGVKYIVGSRNGLGSFGSTQSTILALKALTKYAEFSRKTEESGTIEIYHNDKLVATKNFAKGEKNNIEIAGLEKYITNGKQKLDVKYKDCKNALPYSVNVSYNTSLPQSSKECVLDLTTSINTTNTKVGETVRLKAVLSNITKSGQPMSMAIIGVPAGLSVQPWQLKEMQENKVFDFYEITGNNIVCYFRSLAPGAKKEMNFDLKAEVPGTYDSPASSAYLYYTNEHKVWRGLQKINVF